MKGNLAILDTSVVILLLGDPTLEDAKTAARRERAEQVLADLAAKRAKLCVPTPVIAELCRDGPGSAVYEKLVARIRARTKTLPLTVDGADVAGAARRLALATKREGEERGAILYDALIVGIASAEGARWIVTANARDYESYVRRLQLQIEVIDTDSAKLRGQLKLLAVDPPDAAPPPTPPGNEAAPPPEEAHGATRPAPSPARTPK